MNNKKKSIIIAGGSKGIGNFFCKNFLNENYTVFNLSRNKNKELKKVINFQVDLTKNTLIKKTLIKIKKISNNVDAIIFCVGNSSKAYNQENYKNWKKSFDVNFFSATNLIDQYIKIFNFKKTKIILISSIAGIKNIEAPIPYSVAKSALNFYVRLKSKSLARYKINLNVICPGNILQKNNLWHQNLKVNYLKTKKYIKKNVPLNQFCDPLDIYNLCFYLISNSGNNITGSNFVIDGGQSL